jgi:histone H2A
MQGSVVGKGKFAKPTMAMTTEQQEHNHAFRLIAEGKFHAIGRKDAKRNSPAWKKKQTEIETEKKTLKELLNVEKGGSEADWKVDLIKNHLLINPASKLSEKQVADMARLRIKVWLQGYGHRLLNVAGLVFPLARHHRYLKRRLLTRVGKTAAVCVAATLEYLTSEILELAGNAAKDYKTNRISPRHIMLAVRGDEELNEVFPGTIQSGGVVPHIHKSLVNKKKGQRRR